MIYNNSQKKAVMHTTGPMMVLAGPGSGKTAVITGRTCQLVTSGISASRILVVTFTRAAAKRDEGAVFEGDGKDEYPGHLWNVPRGILRDSAPYVPHVRQQYFKRGREKRLMRELVNHYARDLEEEDLEEICARNQHCEEQSDPAGTLLFRLHAAGKVPRNL